MTHDVPDKVLDWRHKASQADKKKGLFPNLEQIFTGTALKQDSGPEQVSEWERARLEGDTRKVFHSSYYVPYS